ncbi:MAG: hypothetical protein KDK99_03245 [Verrucomicrobiales bacterium]|nr:hypothetical protein [Verrucomicrobiales bacterium]
MPDPLSAPTFPDVEGWYVVHTRTKAEHTAAGMMKSHLGIETYCPRIRFQRATKRGKIWFVEALFPSYFFARFTPVDSIRAVRHSQNVLNVVDFGGQLAHVPDEVIATIQEEMEGQEIREISAPLQPGDAVEVTEGPMRGFRGIVLSLHSGEERVRILLEFLGKQNLVEVQAHNLLSDKSARSLVSTPPRH